MSRGKLSNAEIAVELLLHAQEQAHSIEDARKLALSMPHAPGVMYAVDQMQVRYEALVEAHRHFKQIAERDTAQVVVLADLVRIAGAIA